MHIPNYCALPAGSVVWGYLRDSGGGGQERSVPQQKEVLRAYCEKHHLILKEVFADEAKKGSNADRRDELLRMLAMVRENFKPIHDRKRRDATAETLKHGIIVWKLNRLGRDSTESGAVRYDIRLRGLAVISLSDDILTGNEFIDPILEALLEYKNQLDLDVISSDVKRGIHSSIMLRDNHPDFLRHNPDWQPTGRFLGIWPVRTIPRGYRAERIIVGVRRDGHLRDVQHLVPDPERWDRVRTAWRMRIEEQASWRQIHSVVNLFSGEGGYTHFFRNRIYTGVFEYGGVTYGSPDDPFVEPLIPEEWYEIEASRREARALRRQKGGHAQEGDIDPRRQSHGRLLSGLLICAKCGARLNADFVAAGIVSTTGKKRSRWDFYWCHTAKSSKRQKCDAGRVNAKLLEEMIAAKLEEAITLPRLRQIADRLFTNIATRRREAVEEIEAMKGALAEAKRKADGVVQAVALRPTSALLLHELDALETTISQMEDDLNRRYDDLAYWSSFEIDDKVLERMSSRVREALTSEDVNRARLTIGMYISSIEVMPGKKIHTMINWTFPHPDGEKGLALRSGELSIRRRKKNWYK